MLPAQRSAFRTPCQVQSPVNYSRALLVCPSHTEDCFWTHCGGEGEDGCCIYLRKMNLELLQRRVWRW